MQIKQHFEVVMQKGLWKTPHVDLTIAQIKGKVFVCAAVFAGHTHSPQMESVLRG